MTLTPGGGRSPSTTTPPAPPSRNGSPRPSRDRRMRAARLRPLAIAILRYGVLFGGLVIIADLATLAMVQRTVSPEDQAAIAEADYILNWVLFSILGVAVARATRVVYSGVLAGLVAAVVDTAVVITAQVMAAFGPSPFSALDSLLRDTLVNVALAGLGGVVYALMQRSAGGTRPR